ncbi:MAG: hypothetical protein RL357_488 [Pseudomonadota bacterium]
MTDSWHQSSGAQDEDFKPLTREQARQWRSHHPQVVLAEVMRGQWLWSLCAVAMAWMVGASTLWVAEMLYGVVSVALPSTLMGLILANGQSQSLRPATAALTGFFVWEGIKLLSSIGLMAGTLWWFENPSWLALLVGVVVALKAQALVAWRASLRLKR